MSRSQVNKFRAGPASRASRAPTTTELPSAISSDTSIRDSISAKASLTAGKPATLGGVGLTALLNDGRVLLIGAGAELYDPVSGTFSPVANWPKQDPSFCCYPVVLAGGEVLLVPFESYSGFEIYDPATGTFNLTRAIVYFEFPPITTLLLNGAVLITGGSDGWLGYLLPRTM